MLSNAFVTNSLSTPSRATLLTGQYSHKNGVCTLIGRMEEENQVLSRLMMEAGSEAAMVGKWYLTVEPAAFGFRATNGGT